MGPLRCLFDSDVVIRVLKGESPIALTLLLEQPRPIISIITWIEVMVGTTDRNREATRRFLSSMEVVDVTLKVAEQAVMVRQSMNLKLPDATIYATALTTERTLVTFNVRDFPVGTKSVFTPVG